MTGDARNTYQFKEACNERETKARNVFFRCRIFSSTKATFKCTSGNTDDALEMMHISVKRNNIASVMKRYRGPFKRKTHSTQTL